MKDWLGTEFRGTEYQYEHPLIGRRRRIASGVMTGLERFINLLLISIAPKGYEF
jgi:hypothetical protein